MTVSLSEQIRMRILYLAQRVPYPPDRGDKITTYHEVYHLSKKHEVVVACLADGEADLVNVLPLKHFVSAVDAVPVRSTQAKMRGLATLATGSSFTIAYFNEYHMHKYVAARMRKQRFDAIVVYSSSMAQYVEPYVEVPRVMQFADLDSLKWLQY